MKVAAGKSRETGVYAADAAIAAQKERSGPGIQIDGLWNFVCEFAGFAGQKHRIFDSVALDECAHTRGILQLFAIFEIERDDLETLIVILAVELYEERRFVVAVGT